MSADVTCDKVRKIVQDTIDSSGLEITVDDEMSLIDGGLLDSMSIVKLVQELQQSFDIDIDFADITVSNFDSVNLLTQYVEARSA